MNKETKVLEKPPYPSYKAFSNYIKKLDETGIPAQIDRGVFGNQSGTYISAMIAAFRWLSLIDENGVPAPELGELVHGDDDTYSKKLRELLLQSYPFLREHKIDLKKGTTNQIAAIFRDYGLSGSTLTKAIAFFLGAARSAGYEIGPHMKPPQPPRSNGPKRKPKKEREEEEKTPEAATIPGGEEAPGGMERITVPLRNMDDGVIYFPKDLNQDDAVKAVKMAIFILKNFYGIEEDVR